MNFVVKDLMITILPNRSDLAARQPSTACDAGGTCCPHLTSACTPAPSTHLRVRASEAATLEEIMALKAQLRESLAIAEAREKVILQDLQPKSPEELHLLETLLQGAIEEVRKRSSETKKS